MKPLLRFHGLAGCRAFGFGAPVAITLLLFAALATRAATPYTSTGWVITTPIPGVWCTNASGQGILRGNAHLVRVNSSDARLTGRRLIFVNGAVESDASARLFGTSIQETGTWDPAGAIFTPNGGLWEISYEGVMQTDYSLHLRLVGHGFGGTIDGLRFEETLSREWSSSLIDPLLPYNSTGTLKPRPLNTEVVLDNFSGPAVGWVYYGTPTYSYTRLNGQLVVTGHWPGVITRNVPDTYTLGGPNTMWTVADGQTLEARVDLVNLNESATAARLVLGTDSGFYSIFKGHDFVALSKWSANIAGGPVIMFFYQKAQVPDTNVVLSLALTRTSANVSLTARVLSKANPNTVLYQRSVVDTPNADPVLTSAELQSLSGMSLGLSPDLPGAPFTSGGAPVGVWQYNHDGLRPAAVATFDNLELRQYEVPQCGIQRAVRLSWPSPAGVNYCVEAAPTLQGPWLPCQEPIAEAFGLKEMSVPQSDVMRVFRLRQAP